MNDIFTSDDYALARKMGASLEKSAVSVNYRAMEKECAASRAEAKRLRVMLWCATAYAFVITASLVAIWLWR